MLDKEQFLEHYRIEKAFIDSHLEWNTLEEIYDDYVGREEEIGKCYHQLEGYISDGLKLPIHSIHGRSKSPEHLIEKIIRKRGIEQSHKYSGINRENYRDIVRDLIGVRILILSKEGKYRFYMGAVSIRKMQGNCLCSRPLTGYS